MTPLQAVFRYAEILKGLMEKRLSAKTGWGRVELLREFDAARIEASQQLALELEKSKEQ